MQTPQKRAKHTQPLPPAVLDAYDPPHSARKSPVQFRTSIGPTPQKDGRVLGLFDLLSPGSSAERTPSKQVQGSRDGFELNLIRTPSKRGLEDEGLKSGRLSGRRSFVLSPADASKRAQISSMLTPTARRTLATPSKSTPRSRTALEPLSSDETPAFLRRHSQHGYILPDDASRKDGLEYDNQAISWTPVKPRLGPRMAGKGLSALVRGLREMEEERLDEELDILRELEDAGNARPAPKPHKVPKLFDIADSQTPEMPLGADGANISNTEDNDYIEPEKPGRGRPGKEGKPWKKKGQKRTTRKFTLKPVKGTWKPEPKWKPSAESEDDEEGEREQEGEEGGISTISETQITQTAILQDPTLDDIDDGESFGSDADFEPAETKSHHGGVVLGKKKGQVKGKEEKGAGVESGTGQEAEERGEETKKQNPKPKKKKISPTAHANFRALNIRNKNSKAKGRGRRFGKR